MKFAVFSLMQWPEDRSAADVFRDELDQLVCAERQGYHGAWLAEHHFSRYGIGPSIHLTAAHLQGQGPQFQVLLDRQVPEHLPALGAQGHPPGRHGRRGGAGGVE